MTKNYAHGDGDPLPLGPHPMILSPLEQSDLWGWSALEYMTKYTKDDVNYWWVQHNNHCTSPILQNRKLPPLSTHLWLVSNTLNKAGQSNQDCHLWSELTSNLTRYILYTNETSTEFHNLLLNILHRFRMALNKLTTYNEERARIDWRHIQEGSSLQRHFQHKCMRNPCIWIWAFEVI